MLGDDCDDYDDSDDDVTDEPDDDARDLRGTSDCDGLCDPQCAWCLVGHACPDDCAGGECPYEALARSAEQGTRGGGAMSGNEREEPCREAIVDGAPETCCRPKGHGMGHHSCAYGLGGCVDPACKWHEHEDNAEPRRRAKERTREIEATIAHERANRGKTCVGCGKAIEPDAMRGSVAVRVDFCDSPEQYTGKLCSFGCVGLALRSLADAWDKAAAMADEEVRVKR